MKMEPVSATRRVVSVCRPHREVITPSRHLQIPMFRLARPPFAVIASELPLRLGLTGTATTAVRTPDSPHARDVPVVEPHAEDRVAPRRRAAPSLLEARAGSAPDLCHVTALTGARRADAGRERVAGRRGDTEHLTEHHPHVVARQTVRGDNEHAKSVSGRRPPARPVYPCGGGSHASWSLPSPSCTGSASSPEATSPGRLPPPTTRLRHPPLGGPAYAGDSEPSPTPRPHPPVHHRRSTSSS